MCTPVLLALQVKHHHHHQRGARRPQSAGSGQPRRRYQRVVRNENAPPPDQPDDNPYVVRKFTQVSRSILLSCATFQLRHGRFSILRMLDKDADPELAGIVENLAVFLFCSYICSVFAC